MFIENEKESELKQQVIDLIHDGYGFSTNNGLQIGNGRYYDRLKYTDYKNLKYEEMLSVDVKNYINYIKTEQHTVEDYDTKIKKYTHLEGSLVKLS